MKFKFEKEVEDIINLISQLPDTVTEEEDIIKPYIIISDFDQELRKQKLNNAPSKQWAKLRRQLSFLYEFVHNASMASKKLDISNATKENRWKYNKDEYQILVKSIKDFHSSKALQNPIYIKIGLRYGVVYLSTDEIEILINNNTTN